MQIDELDYLAHYGTPRRSGRYPWGSGNNTETRRTFYEWVKDLLSKGVSEKEIADGYGMTIKELRSARSIAREEIKAADIAMAQGLKDKGNKNTAIAERMGIPESTVRTLLAPGAAAKADQIAAAARMLKKEIDSRNVYLDVGAGSEKFANVSREKLDAALYLLEQEGYNTYTNIPVKQLGTGEYTNFKVLTPPGTKWADARYNTDRIEQVRLRMDDTGLNDIGIKTPLSIDEKRIQVRYREDGGHLEDGVMYLRPGKEDLSLGGKQYGQVRIQVGDTHYLKGMAIYKDDLPPGVDIVFNTNKSKDKVNDKKEVFKELAKIEEGPNKGKIDRDNPFGAQIRRQIVDDNDKLTSAVNMVNEEGAWAGWKDRLASQVLSKQKPRLAQEQLDALHEGRENELNEILALTNPTVKKRLLKEFAESVDAQAVSLEATALPRQAWHAILPINSLKDNEVYAPGYNNGEDVVLIRYPHGGLFEIPELKVNNRNPEGKKIIGPEARDAIGINTKVAERMSGADFDGDAVLVIPNSSRKIGSKPALEGLKNFDPKLEYPKYPGMKVMTEGDKQKKMGIASNLITDMTIRGAKSDEIARAVRYSMVVIDAPKHELNHKLAYERNGIKALQERYQPKIDGKGGASTIISRARREDRRPEEKLRPAKDGGPVNPRTGELVYVPTGKKNYKTGELKLQSKPELSRVRDARKLSSGQPVEEIYASHSNRMKALANKARKAEINTPRASWNPSAKQTYAKEVSSLNAKLAVAEDNRPRERQAQIVANSVLRRKKDENPNMTYATEKKLGNQALQEARARVGAKKERIEISDSEWEAIQAGALSDSNVDKILKNADMDVVREKATPKARLLMTGPKISSAKALLGQGYTRAEVARRLGVSVSTLDRSLDGG